MSEAEEIEASAFSLPALPTAKEQIREIEERMAALYAGEISISPDVVDEVLRVGGNREGSQLRIIYNFMIEQTPEEYTEFVRREYGTGGKGLVIDGTEYSVWFDELGMQVAVGHTVTDRILDKVFLSWEEVSGRIHQLLRQGEYAPAGGAGCGTFECFGRTCDSIGIHETRYGGRRSGDCCLVTQRFCIIDFRIR